MNLMDAFVVEPEDVTEVVLHLLSDDTRYITGTSNPIDAGCLLRV